MKTLVILLVLTGMHLITSLSSHSETDPLTTWVEHVSKVVNATGQPPYTLNKGKSAEDLIQITLDYPSTEAPDPAPSLPNGIQSKEDLVKTMNRLLEIQPTRIMLFYDLSKTIIFGKDIPKAKKINFIQRLAKKIIKKSPASLTYIELMIQYAVFKFAVEEKIVAVSDASYYELGQIKFESLKANPAFNQETDNFFLKPLNDPALKDLSENAIKSLWKRCSDNIKDCPESYLRSYIKDCTQEKKMANMLQERFEWWLKRSIK